MKKLFLILPFYFISSQLYSQISITPAIKCPLPAVINESSGIEITGINKIWSHNDSGGNPELYEMDTTGALLKTLIIQNATNVDWEELAQDSSGNFYIGDFGNNNNDRQNLKIYKIINPDSISGTTTAEVINFSYPDQSAFPPPDPEKNFDMEAMIAFNHSLYLFSKNRTNPYSGYTKLYKLPDTAGTYVANLLDSFYTGSGSFIEYSITSADISPGNNRLIILTNDKCWLFSNFTGDQFFSGTVQQLNLGGNLTQKEGICFINNDELYLTDEVSLPFSGNLYYMNLQPVLNGLENISANKKITLSVTPVPADDEVKVTFNNEDTGKVLIEIYNISGTKVFEKKFEKKSAEFQAMMKTKSWMSGNYLLKVYLNGVFMDSAKLVLSK